ncbi:MAG: right-handed parallel beta-helix repeat-containing protein, partial [Firmicutes bacterium]|nr:right-handed parallel beta-helix repeat-containing protein [Bacillota bacterium]
MALAACGPLAWSPAFAAGIPMRAPTGAVIRLAPGAYRGPLHLTRPFTLTGGGRVTLTAPPGGGAAVTITASEVTLSGIRILDPDPAATAVVIRGRDDRVRDCRIVAAGRGVLVAGGAGVTLSGLDIRPPAGRVAAGDGVDLEDDRRDTVRRCSIRDMRWGVYVGDGYRDRIVGNRIAGSSYGIHLMFSQGTQVTANRFRRDLIGILVMEDSGSTVTGNQVTGNRGSSDAADLELYAALHDRITGNLLEGGRVGLFADNAVDDRIRANRIIGNFLGLRLSAASGNTISGNLLAGNVVEAEALASAGNRVAGNYWDGFQGLEVTGGSRSALPYRASPLLLALREAVPAYQVFFQAPGLQLLQSLFATGARHWLTDPAPLLHPPAGTVPPIPRRPLAAGAAGLVLLMAGLGSFAASNHPFRR